MSINTVNNDGVKRPWLVEYRGSKCYIVFVVVFAIFTDIFLYGIVVPVTPTALRERAGVLEQDAQRWTSVLLGLYGGGLLACSPLAGYLADRVQCRRWPLLIGLLALGASTAFLCVGTHLAFWIVGRLCQGASAAVVWTVGLALLVDSVEKDELGKVLGFVGTGMTLGSLGGPLLGGALYEHGGYYSVFGVAFGFIAIDVVLRLLMIERRDAAKWLDTEGEGRSSVEPLDTAPESEPKDKASSVQKPPLEGGVAIEVAAETEKVCKKRKSALYNLCSSCRFIITLWAYFVWGLILTSCDSVLPLFVEELFSWKQTAQGLIFIPLTFPSFFDPIIGCFTDRFPWTRRYVACAAFIGAVPALVCLRFVRNDTTHDKVKLCGILVLLGTCLAAMLAIILVEVSYIVKEKETKRPAVWGKGGSIALAYGLLNSSFSAGSLVGPFLAGCLREKVSWGTMGWVLALVSGISGVPAFLFFGGCFRKRHEVEANN
ncbi:hypothetical protein ASPVEDRAFT_887062 [Aspergillus versicolor CBS 583.65]|uniref:Major facilitator superfamily (MFS) profile domain-containing protein n=1 Tax=Aspergillus versicolor CBS 583.65 TaxID=1036611 RepID=A0A1L9PJS3_ASPVE|nr:uncharacterized protein ASPVEDRAFT_887062 [Aspergillus versicolor CBS 583.65]OJJ01741.1 hypothetical protein ASPVEDRAFT_887062 [Aspergillus versicolor CBS 583.65]